MSVAAGSLLTSSTDYNQREAAFFQYLLYSAFSGHYSQQIRLFRRKVVHTQADLPRIRQHSQQFNE